MADLIIYEVTNEGKGKVQMIIHCPPTFAEHILLHLDFLTLAIRSTVHLRHTYIGFNNATISGSKFSNPAN